MSLLVGVGLLVVGAGLLLGGAELFADNVVLASRRLGVSVLLVGLLLAGAEPEELVTTVVAAARGAPGIAIGDALGANATLLTLVLGAAALLRPVSLRGPVRGYALAALVASGGAAVVVVGARDVGRLAGVLLLATFVVLVAALWRRDRQVPALGEVTGALAAGEHPQRAAGKGLLWAVAGLVGMTAGGWLTVEGALRLVTALGVEQTAVGLTVVALATTAEFVALLWSTARRGTSQVAVAGIIGSVLYNATVSLGAAALVRPLPTAGATGAAVLTPLLAAGLLAVSLGPGRLGRFLGLLLVLGYLGYVVALLRP